eukprot:15734-Heterococcus_DN1.PRE.2
MQSLHFACSRGELFTRKRWHGIMCHEQWEDLQRKIGREVGKCGSKEMAKWVVHCGSSIYESVCSGAASSARAELLQWLLSRESGIYVRIQDRVTSLLVRVTGQASAQSCYSRVATGQRLYMDGSDMLSVALSLSSSGDLHGIEKTTSLPILQLLHSRGIGGADGVWTDATYKNIMMQAGLHDDLDVLQWAQQHAPTVWPDQLWKASDFSVSDPCTCWSLQCLQWAITQGCPWGLWPESLCRTAIGVKIDSSRAIKETGSHVVHGLMLMDALAAVQVETYIRVVYRSSSKQSSLAVATTTTTTKVQKGNTEL